MTTPLSDQIRNIIHESALTGYRLSEDSGLTRSMKGRFLAGKIFNSCTLDRIVAAIPAKFKKTLKP
jgi:predicted transcriptional regulator